MYIISYVLLLVELTYSSSGSGESSLLVARKLSAELVVLGGEVGSSAYLTEGCDSGVRFVKD